MDNSVFSTIKRPTKKEMYAEDIKNKRKCPLCYRDTTPENYINLNPNHKGKPTKNCDKCRAPSAKNVKKKRESGDYKQKYYYKSAQKKLDIVLEIMSLIDEDIVKKAVEAYKDNARDGFLDGFELPHKKPSSPPPAHEVSEKERCDDCTII